MKKIALLGSTGSIGVSTLKIVDANPQAFCVSALAAHSNISLLAQQIRRFHPQIVCVYEEKGAKKLKNEFPNLRIVSGEEGLEEIVSLDCVDFVVMAIVGMQALKPTIHAINAGKPIGLASKEVLVSAGEFVQHLAGQNKVPLIPIDSEHSALFQCLQGKNVREVRRVILTASGGPFRNYSLKQLEKVSVEEALAHPTWHMGKKVTIDSSTLVNKGLEMIEARWLFDLPPEKIDVVIHPQSLIHSFVEFIDGSMLAQMNEPDMVFPIQYALTYPDRIQGLYPPFDFTKNSRLEFDSPDYTRFPALKLAWRAIELGTSFPCYFNAANEVLVDRFLKHEIRWSEIALCLDRLLEKHTSTPLDSLQTIFSVDREARSEAGSIKIS